ncbi:MAG: tetratricopeptide repeat protein [Proteobacteria bacterium]|nr:tetratricopeptide repeat protein [Pseudomonadota bacterium]
MFTHNRSKKGHRQSLFVGLIVLPISIFILNGCSAARLTDKQTAKLDTLEKRIIELERQKFRVRDNMNDDATAFREKVLKDIGNFRKSQRFFISELNKLKNDMSLITNDNEIAQHNLRKNTNRIKRLIRRLGDQAITIDELHKFFKAGIDPSPNSTNEEQYAFEKSFGLFKNKKLKDARKSFLDFREKYPNSDLADDSLYFIANIHFLKGEYNKATLRFFELLKQFPNSNRLHNAKWWLGVALERSGDLSGALDVYKELTVLDRQNPLRIKAEFRLEELSSQNKANPKK